jgi:hypothetical protein
VSKRTKFLLGIGVIAALVIGWQVAAFGVLSDPSSGFQGNDGDLDPAKNGAPTNPPPARRHHRLE